MEALLSSTLAVTLAEIGDKTQLLTLLLISRYHRPYAIAAGILLATLVNHGLSAWLGDWLADALPAHWLPWLVGSSFLAVALWTLIPDKAGDPNGRLTRYGAFVATLILFFLAEIGDRTQVATVVLAARYEAFMMVVAGSTLGMLAANLPVLAWGPWALQYIPLRYVRWAAAGLFVVLAVISLAGFGPGG